MIDGNALRTYLEEQIHNCQWGLDQAKAKDDALLALVWRCKLDELKPLLAYVEAALQVAA